MVTADGDPVPAQPRQLAAYANYIQLAYLSEANFSGSLEGKLVAAVGFRRGEAEVSIAANIAGGCFLGIEPDPSILKAAVKNAPCDFMVNTLDEALRVLKNELRKHQPLAVGLAGEPNEVIAEMAERGVQPDVVTDAESSTIWLPFLECGAIPFTAQGETNPSTLAPNVLVWTAAYPDDMRRLDRAAQDWLPSQDGIRQRWLEHASARFYHQLPLERVLGVTEQEATSLMDALKASGPWRGTVSVSYMEEDGARAIVL